VENEKADNEEKTYVLEDYERLSIREQNTVNYESIQCIVIPTLDNIETVLCMILEILGDDDDE
jgi:hypothetical protein